MEYIENKDLVFIFDKHIGLDTLASKLALLSGDQTRTFFLGREIKIPRRINAMALTSALNERIKTLDSHSLTRDGFIKLENYATFTEFQLQNLFDKIGTAEDFFLYRKNLWKLLIKNHIGIKLQDGELVRLINLRKSKIDSFQNYTKAIFVVTLDSQKEFDACPLNVLEDRLKLTFSLEEIRQLADKYNFSIPTRLKKDELLGHVKAMMKSKRKLTLALGRELNNMTLAQLNEFCVLQGLGISSNLKKDEMITLLSFLVKQAGFTTIDTKQIHGSHFSEPLKFRIDLDAVDNFKRGLPKKVIYLDEDEIKAFHQLDEYVEEAVVKTNSNDDLIFEILKKLLPYMNVDEETAKLAIHQGIAMPEVKEPKRKTTTVAQKTVQEIKVTSKKAAPKKQEEKSKYNDEILDEIIRKVRKLREKDKLEEEKEKIAEARKKREEDIEELIAIFDDNEEYDHLDFEPEDDVRNPITPAQKSLEEVLKELRPQNKEIPAQSIPAEEPPLDIDYVEPASLSSEPDEVIEVEIDSHPEEDIEPASSSVENLQEEEPLNESYDEQFLKEEGLIPVEEELQNPKEFLAPIPVGPLVDLTEPKESMESDFVPMENPYFENKRMNFKWKPVIVSISTIAVIFIAFISIMAVIHAFK